MDFILNVVLMWRSQIGAQTFSASCSKRRSWKHWSSFSFLMCHSCCRFCRVPWSLSSRPLTLAMRLCASTCVWHPWWWSLGSPLAPPRRLMYPLSLTLLPPLACACSLCSSLRPCASSSSTDALVALFLSAACSSMSRRAPSRSRGRSRWDNVSWSSSRRASARAASLANVSKDSRTWNPK